MSYALITGASSGIGKALAYEFAKAKHNLVLVARSSLELQTISRDIQETYGVTCLFIADDLVKHTVPYTIYEMCRDKWVQIDYLVNNAGFGDYGPFLTSSSQKDLGMIDLNIRALTIMTKLFLPDMVQRGMGKIMNVASTAAFQAGPLMAIYFATKAYVLSFSEALAEELVWTWVTVTALCPGPTTSKFQIAASATDNKMFAWNIPTSDMVAAYGFTAMMRGQRIAIHGFMNKFLVFLTRITPRFVLAKIVKNMQTK
jgi:uncharacterized protein